MISFFAHLTTADLIIVGIIGLSMIISLLRGFIREALSLSTWLIAAYLAFSLSSSLSEKLSGMVSSASTRTAIAFIGIFLLVVIIGAVANFFIGRLISLSGLGLIDRLLGIFFGAARGILLCALVVLMIKGSSLTDRDWWKGSQLIPQFDPITVEMQRLFPAQLSSPKDAAQNTAVPKK